MSNLTSADETKRENNSRRDRRLRENRINLYNIQKFTDAALSVYAYIRTKLRTSIYLADFRLANDAVSEDRAIKRVNKRLSNERGLNGANYRPAIHAPSRFDDLSDEG